MDANDRVPIYIRYDQIDAIFALHLKLWDRMKCGGGPPISIDIIGDLLDQLREAKPNGDIDTGSAGANHVCTRNDQTIR